MHPGLAPSESAPAATRVTAPEEIIALARLARAGAGGGGPEAVLRTAVELLAVRIPHLRATVYTGGPAQAVLARPALGGQRRPGAPLERDAATALAAGLDRARSAGGQARRDPEGTWLVACAADEEIMGGLELTLGHEPSALDQAWLSIVADHVGAALRHARLVERLEQQAGATTVAAGAAHELSNLISAIVGRAQLLRRAVVEPVAARSIEVIEQAAIDGSSLVRRIRGRAGGEARTLILAPLVRETIDRASTRLEGRAPEARIDVQLELGEARAISGDAGQLRQVLTNLVYNAIDAMPHGGQLAVRLGAAEDGQAAWIEVVDTGIGMDTETARRMFEPFFTTKGAAGTGLGLSVSREIVDRHGGRFEVSSEPGRGTRIRVWLPASPEDLPFPWRRPSALTAVLEGASTAPSPPGPPKILLIDDDTAVREVLAEMLRTADYEVVEAASGAAGLAFLRASPFDLVFTDLGMPDMNGWEVAARVRAVRPNTRVGIITGWDVRIDDTRRRALGVEVVIVKPFRLQQVLDTVRGALDG
jgi:signal transduction histidine kinase